MDGGKLHLREMKFFFFLSFHPPSVNLDFLSKKALEGTGSPPTLKGKRKSLNFSSFFLLRLRKEKLEEEEEEARFTVGDGREAEGFFGQIFFCCPYYMTHTTYVVF